MSIATVVSITGQAWARDADGNMRELRVGDTLLEGESLVTSDSGRVELDFADNLDPTVIEGGQEVAMTLELDADQPVDMGEFSALDEDLEALLAAIDDGDGDLLDVLDATAAGAGPGGGADGGHNFVQLARIAEAIDPLAFEFGVGLASELPEIGGGAGIGGDTAPIIPTVDADFNLVSIDNVLQATLTGNSTNASTITVVLTGGGLNETFTVTPESDGTWSVDLSDIEFEDGVEYSVDVTATSPDGNTATAEDSDSYTLPTVEITEFDVSSANNEVSSELTGSAENASSVTITITGPDGLTITETVTVGEDGSWSLDLGSELPEGEYSVEAVAGDDSGNTSDPAGAESGYTLPTVEIDSFVVDSNDNSVSSELTGSTTNASSVDVVVTGPNGEVFSGNVPVDSDGNWSVDLGSDLPEGEYGVEVIARDGQNNTTDPLT
ncbi:retention module-containing protein, partial [Billgrantia endophytica]